MAHPRHARFHDLLQELAQLHEAQYRELCELRAEQPRPRPPAISFEDEKSNLSDQVCPDDQHHPDEGGASVPLSLLPSLLGNQVPLVSPTNAFQIHISSSSNGSSQNSWADQDSPKSRLPSVNRRSIRMSRQLAATVPVQQKQEPRHSQVEGVKTSRRRNSILESGISNEADTKKQGDLEKVQRLCSRFGDCEYISPQSVLQVLSKAGTCTILKKPVSLELMEVIMAELQIIAHKLQLEEQFVHVKSDSSEALSLPWPIFVELMSLPTLSDHASRGRSSLISQFQTLLLSRQVHEVIEHAADLQGSEAWESINDRRKPKWHLVFIDRLVSIAIAVSVASVGLSLDHDPDAVGWKVLEVIVATIFSAEVIVKCLAGGLREYTCGESRYMNWFDLMLVALSLADIACEFLGATTGSTRMGIVLRAVRMSRILRLVKIFRSQMLRELSNMISGMLTGLPALMWIIVVIILFIYFCGIAGRQALGPSQNSLVSTCDKGDSYDTWDVEDPVCKIHYVYGSEFCGSVEKCMFTTFRCLIGDCSTAGGRSLAAIFSEGYGLKFRFSYCVSMIVTIFGFFNVVTALMVESTISGVKYNEVQKKCSRISEAKYVARKLEEFVSITTILTNSYRSRRSSNLLVTADSVGRMDSTASNELEEITSLTPREVLYIFEHADIKNVLADLDISPDPSLVDLIELYANESDEVQVTDILAVLFKLRGEVQKLDLVSLRESLCQVVSDLRENDTSIMSSQQKIMQRLEQLGGRLPDQVETHTM